MPRLAASSSARYPAGMSRTLLIRIFAVLVVGAAVWGITRWLDHRHAAQSVAHDPFRDSSQPAVAGGPVGLTRSAKPAVPVAAARSDGAAARTFAKGKVVIQGGWGGQPGQFGRRADPESNPESPMALAVGKNGEVQVVDQVNRRVQRFKDGKPVGQIPVGGDTVQDLAGGPEGRTVLLDRLADRNVSVYDKDGKLISETSLVGKGIDEGGAATAVFADDDGVWVEREHGSSVRVADANGNADPNRPELPGRPTRDGRMAVTAALLDRMAGTMQVNAYDRSSGQLSWSAPIQLPAPIWRIVLLDSDDQGMVYVAADTGHETSAEPFEIYDEGITVVRLGAGGAVRGTLELPPISTPDETFRPLSVGGDGSIYEMLSGPQGVQVTQYNF
jgi:hypothetical protein